MVLCSQQIVKTVIYKMATVFLLLSGQFLLISPDMTKTLASAKNLKATTPASEPLNNQTYLMKIENDQPVRNISNSSEKPQSPEENDNISCLATNETADTMKQSKQHNMTNRTVVLKDVDTRGLDTNDSLEERASSVFHGDETFSTLKQLITEPFDTSTSAISSTPLMNTVSPDPIMTFTCESRCNTELSFPCSCSASCVVYGTCCENITLDCPHVWEEGLTRFEHLLQSDIICSDNFIFMISSCPRTPRKNAKRKETSLSTTGELSLENMTIKSENQIAIFDDVDTTPKSSEVTEFISENVSQSDRSTQVSIVERLKKALAAAPVTDSDTGLTFINKSIYDCNKMSQSTAMVWSVESTYNHISPTKMEVFESLQLLNYYELEFGKQIFKAHQCMQNIIEKCDQTAVQGERYEEYTDKCQTTFALMISRFPTTAFYRNIFCAYCNQRLNSNFELVLDNAMMKSNKFRTLMSISKHGTISVTLFQTIAIDLFPWSQAQCSIPDYHELSTSSEWMKESANAESDGRAVCSVTCRGGFFKAQSDGLCKAQHTALLAIADDGLPPLCPAAMNSLAKFLVCGLKSEVESLSYADLDSQSVSVMFDASLNKSLYVIEINLALIHSSFKFFSYDEGDTIQNIYHVALLVKSFQNYRSSHDLCTQQNLENRKLNSDLRVIRTFSLDNYVSITPTTRSLAQGMEELRGPPVDKQNTTTLCLTTLIKLDKAYVNPLRCTEDPVYKLDATLINDFRNSSRCFSYFDNLEVPKKDQANTAMKNGSFLNEGLAIITLLVVLIEIVKI
ncbi:hypothetical protein PoB_000090500 [Plakobranchus ocellatus]|uniref:SMB domain-containing protein n=1 Tax=Plakobranchus ocellatus TaxID=259542 RepID=A0AAV3XUS8_9GAST|nr:hypothetical protein PoB_000090500 [Plakobranchus ocellatus]